MPAIVDLAAMRDAMKRLGGDPRKINPLQPVELVIDHSVQVDEAGTPQSFMTNAELEFQRNRERYAFLRWGQNAFENFRVVPPDTGIVHQVNLEYLARVVFTSGGNGGPAPAVAYPDTLVGTDSHTTMINGLGVLGWGVGGIEAEAAMLGQPVSMLVPQVVGFRLTGSLPEGATATDLVLTVTQMLRRKGVVGKFVEYFGDGLANLPLADRATIANMAPEYGATCGLFPIDAETLRYLRLTGRPESLIQLVEAYAKAQGMFHTATSPEVEYSDTLELDLSTVEPSLAGPRRPQDRVPLKNAKTSFHAALEEMLVGATRQESGGRDIAGRRGASPPKEAAAAVAVAEPEVDKASRPAGFDHERLGRDRRDHQLHEYVEPVGHGCGRFTGQEGRRARPAHQPVGQGQPGARLEGRDRLPAGCGARHVSRQAAIQPGRLRLHDMYRQLGAAAGRGLRGYPTRRPGGRGRPERQPQFRGADQCRRAGQLPGFAAAGRRVRPGRHHGHRSPDRAPGRRPGGPAGLSTRTSGPASGRSRIPWFARFAPRCSRPSMPRSLQGDAQWNTLRGAGGRPLRVGPAVDLREEPALLSRHDGRAAAGRADRRRPGARRGRRQHHDRPHLAGRLDQGRTVRPAGT